MPQARIRKVNVEAWIPESMRRDLRELLRKAKEKEMTDLLLFIPVDAYGSMILDIQNQMVERGMGYIPWIPVIFPNNDGTGGTAIIPHARPDIALKARPDEYQDEPVMFNINGSQTGV